MNDDMLIHKSETFFVGEVLAVFENEIPQGYQAPLIVAKTFDMRLFISEHKKLLLECYKLNWAHYQRTLIQLLLAAGCLRQSDYRRPHWVMIKDFSNQV